MVEAMILGVFKDDDEAIIYNSGTEEEMRRVFTDLVTDGTFDADNFYLVKVLVSAETELCVTEHC